MKSEGVYNVTALLHYPLCPFDPSFPPPVRSNFISIDSYRPNLTGQVETENKDGPGRCSVSPVVKVFRRCLTADS